MRPILSTFSIVASDLKAGEWGVAVQSKFLAVGSVVPWAQANVGAIATQAYANTSYGPRGLEMLRLGFSADEVIEKLTELDENRDHRQIGIVDVQGRSAAFTGKKCYDWAGHLTGKNFSAQGNILVSKKTVEAIASAFEKTKGRLAERLIAALHGGQKAGGDKRGQQSAALLIKKEKAGYGGFTDTLVDLRVDDHPTPILELERLFGLYDLYFGPTLKKIKLDTETVKEIQKMLAQLGYYRGNAHGKLDPATRQTLEAYHNTENLEMRFTNESDTLDEAVLKFMQAQCRR
ncbi:DUF1028 domain-containing protein [Candidatus Acetothermia bacterium]|nr:DUF1028 domain-containing protein [Candidatus Acetothermia bacterium]MBI3459493.1 DUF1028 domain-containing protein [Candidatus Acetothermia bacterium]